MLSVKSWALDSQDPHINTSMKVKCTAIIPVLGKKIQLDPEGYNQPT